jgi:hypothetical protein
MDDVYAELIAFTTKCDDTQCAKVCRWHSHRTTSNCSIVFRLFDQERRILELNARSASTRSILNTFYTYEQVIIPLAYRACHGDMSRFICRIAYA